MLRKIKYTLILVLALTAISKAHASIMFDFTIEELGDFNGNAAIGDSFSITFVDDSNFSTGITASDFESLSYNTEFLGFQSWDVNLCDNCLSSHLNQLFSFTDLSGGDWQLDILVGVTGTFNVFADEEGPDDDNEVYLQLGQTVDGNGSTSIAFGAPGIDSTFVHYFSGTETLTATTIDVVEPNGIFLLSALGLLLQLRLRRNLK